MSLLTRHGDKLTGSGKGQSRITRQSSHFYLSILSIWSVSDDSGTHKRHDHPTYEVIKQQGRMPMGMIRGSMVNQPSQLLVEVFCITLVANFNAPTVNQCKIHRERVAYYDLTGLQRGQYEQQPEKSEQAPPWDCDY